MVSVAPDGIDLGGATLLLRDGPMAWPFGASAQLGGLDVVEDGFLQAVDPAVIERRAFLGLSVPEEAAAELLPLIGGVSGVNAEQAQMLTTSLRLLYGTLSFLGLIMFGVFSLLTGCALLFKQLNEAAADRPKYQAMMHMGATRRELGRAAAVQVGLTLLVPVALGFVHAAFAVRVMGELFQIATTSYLLIAAGIYAIVVSALYGVMQNRFMKIVS